MKRVVTALVCAAAVLAFASSADARPAFVTFTVKNDRGVRQAGTDVWSRRADCEGKGYWCGHLGRSDGDGRVTVPVSSGDELLFVRGQPRRDGGECNPPEWPGAGFTVPRPVRSAERIVLPEVSHADYAPHSPALSESEREFLGLLNRRRAAEGMRRVHVSGLLTAVADRYAGFLHRGSREIAHCTTPLSSPHVRAKDAGWGSKSAGVGGEVLRLGSTTGRGAFEAWMASPSHRKVLLDRRADLIGVARAERYWAAEVGSSLDAPSGSFKGVWRRGSLVRAGFPVPHRAPSRAEDGSRLAAVGLRRRVRGRAGSAAWRVRLVRRAGAYRVTGRLPAGRYRLVLRYDGAEVDGRSWYPRRVCRRFRVSPPRPGAGSRRTELRTARC